jgi:hypothetical protein
MLNIVNIEPRMSFWAENLHRSLSSIGVGYNRHYCQF